VHRLGHLIGWLAHHFNGEIHAGQSIAWSLVVGTPPPKRRFRRALCAALLAIACPVL